MVDRRVPGLGKQEAMWHCPKCKEPIRSSSKPACRKHPMLTVKSGPPPS